MKIGNIVFVTMEGPPQDPRSAIPKVDPSFPAIVHKIYEDDRYIGVTVFTDEGPRLLRKISYSDKGEVGTWRRVL